MSMASGSPELWLMDFGTGAKRQLTHAGELSEYPSWKSSGRELVFGGIRGGNFEVLRISARGGRERNLTNHPAADKWPAWSPDGRRVAFTSDRDGGEDVYVMRADGSDVRNVSRTREEEESHPAWTPDGRLSFLQHGQTGPVHVRVIDPVRGDYDLPIDAVFVFDWAG
jgi:TolB protein